jgi:ATP-dependent DNA helicase DinG
VKQDDVERWRRFFPFSSIRPEQEKAINFAIDSYESGKRYVILEIGTGGGKSAIGVTISRYLESNGKNILDDDNMPLAGSYILTTQKVLQQQYIDDFGPGTGVSKNLMLSIKSSTNYTCGFYKDQTCAESRRVLSQLGKRVAGTEYHKHCRGGKCGYAKDKQSFIESPISITNFSYFFAETTYGKKLVPRNLLIVDEAHNIEQQLGKFIEVTYSEKFAKEVLKCRIPALNTQEAVHEWICKTYKNALTKHLKGVEKALHSKFDSSSFGFGDLSKQYEMLDKHICKVNRFIASYTPDNWVMNIVRPMQGKRGGRRFEFKPVDVSKFSYESLFQFGGQTLMMSATIVDKDVFCKSVGLDVNDVAFLSIPSPFPVGNRPIHYVPTGSMSMDNIAKTLPTMAHAVGMLMEQHEKEKGVIHCVNYRIAQFLIEHVKSPRLLTHTSDNRDAILKLHMESLSPTVLLSPSMMEGVDLADDSSRFQILCKVPFPYLGDAVIKKRMANNKAWYTYQTVKSIIQAFGRSIRNEQDHAVSYILDSDWDRFYRMNGRMFPKEFSDALLNT